MVTCPACGHDESLHRHIAEGGCEGIIEVPYFAMGIWTPHRGKTRCGCTRNPRHVAAELDDPSEDVIARGEARDAQERREEPNP